MGDIKGTYIGWQLIIPLVAFYVQGT